MVVGLRILWVSVTGPLPRKLALNVPVALMVFDPEARLLVVKVAWPLLRVTAGSLVPPMTKVMVPAGATPVWEVTTAVKVTD